MSEPLIAKNDYLRVLLDAMPSMVIVLDKQFRILDANEVAIIRLGRGKPLYLKRLCGEVLGCANLRNCKVECGDSESCNDCLIRRATRVAIAGGSLLRQHQRMAVEEVAAPRYIDFLITSNPFHYRGRGYVLMVLEDISELRGSALFAGGPPA